MAHIHEATRKMLELTDSDCARLGRIASELADIASHLDSVIQDRDEGILISGVEAARLLGRSENAVSRMVKDGRLHRVTLGASTGIRLSEVLARK